MGHLKETSNSFIYEFMNSYEKAQTINQMFYSDHETLNIRHIKQELIKIED